MFVRLRRSWCVVLSIAVAACSSHPSPPGARASAGPAGEPQALASLDGKRVLAILIPKRTPQVAFFVVSPAHWTGTALKLAIDSTATVVVPSGASIPVARLRKFIVPEHVDRVQDLAHGAAAAVALFTDAAPPVGALKLEYAFFGLGQGADGEALLFEGEP